MRFLAIAFILSMVTITVAAQVNQPDGSGHDPYAITCMIGEKPTGSQFPLRICYTNAQWAALKTQYIAIAPDGHPFLSPDAPPGTEVIGPAGRPLLAADDPHNAHVDLCTRHSRGQATTVACGQ
jgi:hypothetical protein